MDWLRTTLPGIELIQERLKMIIPKELDPNGFILRDMGARSIFVMLYGFCVDKGNWIRPATITCMNDTEASKLDEQERIDWLNRYQKGKAPKNIPDRWYQENTREPIRDETIRELVRLGCIIEKEGLATTSPVPRYTLQKDFAELFNPELKDNDLIIRVNEWREKNLSASVLARIALAKKMVTHEASGILVTLPNGEVRKLSPGPSSELVKAVIEKFAKHFLKTPAVILISESAKKIIARDDELCTAVGFKIDVSNVLPDIILVDLGIPEPLMVFVECVATDGPISDRRKQELIDMINAAGYKKENCTFVTVFRDRTDSISKSRFSSIAWGTFVWYATEPESIIFLNEGNERKIRHLADLLEV